MSSDEKPRSDCKSRSVAHKLNSRSSKSSSTSNSSSRSSSSRSTSRSSDSRSTSSTSRNTRMSSFNEDLISNINCNCMHQSVAPESTRFFTPNEATTRDFRATHKKKRTSPTSTVDEQCGGVSSQKIYYVQQHHHYYHHHRMTSDKNARKRPLAPPQPLHSYVEVDRPTMHPQKYGTIKKVNLFQIKSAENKSSPISMLIDESHVAKKPHRNHRHRHSHYDQNHHELQQSHKSRSRSLCSLKSDASESSFVMASMSSSLSSVSLSSASFVANRMNENKSTSLINLSPQREMNLLTETLNCLHDMYQILSVKRRKMQRPTHMSVKTGQNAATTSTTAAAATATGRPKMKSHKHVGEEEPLLMSHFLKLIENFIQLNKTQCCMQNEADTHAKTTHATNTDASAQYALINRIESVSNCLLVDFCVAFFPFKLKYATSGENRI